MDRRISALIPAKASNLRRIVSPKPPLHQGRGLHLDVQTTVLRTHRGTSDRNRTSPPPNGRADRLRVRADGGDSLPQDRRATVRVDKSYPWPSSYLDCVVDNTRISCRTTIPVQRPRPNSQGIRVAHATSLAQRCGMHAIWVTVEKRDFLFHSSVFSSV